MYSFQGTFCQPEVFEVYTDMIGWFVAYVLFGIVVYEASERSCGENVVGGGEGVEEEEVEENRGGEGGGGGGAGR
ncbi:hypothetical protein BC937DRAFT_87509 [Endogone sp. FLAS-F59071]|nr:hypothetical protein BC937DRAFT_87509 [Endogone sp. FLAS-F59071]|eukprot:RUS12569.1 hypothetical protein BC937DRAFT_87509 [Endogone sp. FLAS-F59071]